MTSVFQSPVGNLYITTSVKKVVAILWNTRNDLTDNLDALHLKCHNQLSEYFDGERQKFDLPLSLKGTVFQIEVWNELIKLQFGSYTSYGQISQKLGDIKKSRAVGGAIGANLIMIACHRVIGINQSLTGYAGGVKAKGFLLNLEKGQTNLFI
ncbi:MAG: methylated-DNA--[protein]-cysteine S-methyltransferase [Salibacteraceae bacterium]